MRRDVMILLLIVVIGLVSVVTMHMQVGTTQVRRKSGEVLSLPNWSSLPFVRSADEKDGGGDTHEDEWDDVNSKDDDHDGSGRDNDGVLRAFRLKHFKSVAFVTHMQKDDEATGVVNLIGATHRFHHSATVHVYVGDAVSDAARQEVANAGHAQLFDVAKLRFGSTAKEANNAPLKGDHDDDDEDNEDERVHMVPASKLLAAMENDGAPPAWLLMYHAMDKHATAVFVPPDMTLLKRVLPLLRAVRKHGALKWSPESASDTGTGCTGHFMAMHIRSKHFLKLYQYVQCLADGKEGACKQTEGMACEMAGEDVMDGYVTAIADMDKGDWEELRAVNAEYSSHHGRKGASGGKKEGKGEGAKDVNGDAKDNGKEGQRKVADWVQRAHDEDKTVIALLVASISKGYTNVDSLPLFKDLLPSMTKTVTEEERGAFMYVIYLGYDKGDGVYDNEDNLRRLRELVEERKAGMNCEVRYLRVEGMEGKPVHVWNALAKQAHEDGCDYFFQANDDLEMITPGWTGAFVHQLQHNPTFPNFGIVGPKDVHNDKTITQAFVHGTHMEIHGALYPDVFQNWYSDDYLTWVYRKENTFWIHEYKARNVNKGGSRYTPHNGAPLMNEQLELGCKRIQEFLGKHRIEFDCTPQVHWWDPEEERNGKEALSAEATRAAKQPSR